MSPFTIVVIIQIFHRQTCVLFISWAFWWRLHSFVFRELCFANDFPVTDQRGHDGRHGSAPPHEQPYT